MSINKKIVRRSFLGAYGVLFLLFASAPMSAQAQRGASSSALELKPGARVLFLGGSLFENEIAKGYLEYVLATRWPDREITFRNLGWMGDNVFAEARSTFTTPPTPYQQLFQQIRHTEPDYVFLAYGGVEAQRGQAGVKHFTQGLEAIIDSIDAMGAQTILVSPIPVREAGDAAQTATVQKNLKLYTDAISSVASRRKKRFVDFYTQLAANMDGLFLDNGIHLNEAGYYFLAQTLESQLGWASRGSTVAIDASQPSAPKSEQAKILSSNQGGIVFTYREPLLPLPVTASGVYKKESSVTVEVRGLAAGFYTLTENGRQLATASAADWAAGVILNHGISQTQAARLSDYIAKKNGLFFQQYRPMNRTYILGFRSYEQGNHKQGLEDMDFIIAWLEGQINVSRQPVIKTYELRPLK